MSLEVHIHDAQLAILRELLFHQFANYAVLQKPTGLTSDHFNFHIMRLVELGLVERVEKGVYRLTENGKEYANKLDTDNSTIERQPKMAVMLMIHQTRDGEDKFIVQERLKNPHFGYFGFPTGKVRWGETVERAAERECYEEIGISTQFQVKGAYHEHTFLDDDMLEDKLFFICEATDVDGEIKEHFEGGNNQWLPINELLSKDKHFSSVEDELKILNSETWLIEKSVRQDRETF